MNTRTSEVYILLQELLAESLQQGIAPDFLSLVKEAELDELGTVKQTYISPGVALSEEINTGLSNTEHYIQVMDEAHSLQIQELVKHRGEFPARIGRLERWYRRLATKAQALLAIVRSGTGSLYTITDDFSSLDGIDVTNTSAYIDTETGIAELNFGNMAANEDAGSGFTNASISSVLLKDGPITVDNIVYETNSLSYKYSSKSTKGVELTLTIVINASNLYYNNTRLSFRLLFPDNTNITSITSSSDNINFEELDFYQKGEYVFIPISKVFQSNRVTIKFLKNTHEGVKSSPSEDAIHQFIFDIRDIRVPNRVYKSTGNVRTIQYPLPSYLATRGIAQYSLKMDSYSLGDTSIRPKVSFDSQGYSYIEPNKLYPIGMSSNLHSSHVSYTVLRKYPTPIVRLSGTTGEFVPNESWLYEGYGQAEVESKTYDAGYGVLSSWVSSGGTRAYQDLVSTGIYLGGAKIHKVYMLVYSQVSKDIVFRNVGVKHPSTGSFNNATIMKFYFNSQEVFGTPLPDSTLEYKVTLLPGENVVNMVVGCLVDGGYLNFGDVFLASDTIVYGHKRRSTAAESIVSLDQKYKAYSVSNGSIYLNYEPPYGAKFEHVYTTPTENIPSTVSLDFEMVGADQQSPLLTKYVLEFSTGSAL